MSRSLERITIIASDLCEDIGDSTEFHHIRFQKKLLEAFREINLYLLPDTEIITKIFPADGQIELPCDFVYETKIGLLKNGVLVTLDLNKNLRLNNTKSTDSQIESDINGYFDGSVVPGEFMPFYNCFRGGNFLGELYGLGCGYHSNQWYNIKDGVLEIGSLIPDDCEVVIEYKSNGLSDGFKLVPTEIVMAMKYYAKARFYEDAAPSKAAYFTELYNQQYYRIKRLYSYRKPEYLAWVFKSSDRAMHL